MSLTTKIMDRAGLAALERADWNRLSSRALCENPYYSRQHLLGVLETIESGNDVSALAIHAGTGELLGLMPYRARLLAPFPWRVAEAASNRYQSSSTPLIDAEAAPAVVGAFLETLGHDGVPAFWAFADIENEGGFTDLLAVAARAERCGLARIGAYSRPRLTRLAGGLATHLDTTVPRDRLKRIRRSLKRLGERGVVGFERVREPAAMRARLEQFLALEDAGWKGRQGTSLLADTATADFARRCYGGIADREGLAFIDSLLLDGQPIAMALNIASGRMVYCPKSAYDEAWRSFSPGLVLDYLAIEQLYADDAFDAFDAATTVDGHVLAELWNESRPMARHIVGPADWRTEALAAGWQQAHNLRTAAKRSLSAGVAAPLARLMRRAGGALSAVVTGVLVMLPDLMLGFKRHEWAAAPLTGAI